MPLKRPASKGLSMKEQLKQLQSGVPHAEKDEDKPEEGEEEEVKQEDQRLWSLMRVKSVQRVLVESSTGCSRLVKFHSRSKRFGIET